MRFRSIVHRSALAVVTSLSLGVLLAGNSPAAAERSAVRESPIGRTVENFALEDYRGKSHSLSDLQDQQLVVVCFLGPECPLAKLYGPRLQQLAAEFADRHVAFLGVSSNAQDSLTELAAYARVHGLEFPILKDLGSALADRFGATRTPEVFVLDRERVIRYCGRIDGQYTFGSGVGLAAPQEGRRDLTEAIQDLLAGKDVRVPVTEARGCLIGRSRVPKTESPVTYSNQISRLIQQRCLECHREGQIAPFALTNYDDVAGWGEMIAEVIREQRMPPWHANSEYGHFANENRLSEDEKQLVYTWVENGCPEGDSSQLPAPRQFHEGWFLPREPDQIVYMSEEPVAIKAEGVEPYRRYVADPGITEDKWVKISECMPGNRAAVHHIIVYVKPPNGFQRDRDREEDEGLWFLAGFAPGTRPLVSPPGWAKKIPAGSKLVFEMHYTPIGTPQTDRSSIGLIFADPQEVTHELVTKNTLNHEFEIPAGADNHKVEAKKTFRNDEVLLSLFPHMHMRGKAFRYELTYPDGKLEVLLDVPRYDFNWQNSYILAEPKVIPKGSQLHCTAYFDNSERNLANPDPTQPIRWGPQTWDEMMIGWYDVGTPLE